MASDGIFGLTTIQIYIGGSLGCLPSSGCWGWLLFLLLNAVCAREFLLSLY